MTIDAARLEGKLRAELRGEVRFDPGSRALYATDSSNYRQTPIGVVIPRDEQDVMAAVNLCREFGAPITSRGAATSIAGQCCNVAVILDFSKYLNRVLEVDPKRRLARVQPGTVCDTLRDAAEEHGLTFGPDPATHAWCTIGGMIGNNSCGVHSQMAGRTSDNIEALEVLTYRGDRFRAGRTTDRDLHAIIQAGGPRGEIYRRLDDLRQRYAELIRRRFPRIPRRVSGYNLDVLLPENDFHVGRSLVGSEGTCVVILEAIVNLVHSPPHRTLLVIGFDDIYEAADEIPEVTEAGPIGLEGVDKMFIDDLKKKNLHLENIENFPEGNAFLLAEFGGDTEEESVQNAERVMKRFRRAGRSDAVKLFRSPERERRIWNVRESGLGATAHVPGQKENWEGWEDSAVPPENLGEYLRELKGLYRKYGYIGTFYGHFGQGCVHTRIDFGLKSAQGVKQFRAFMEEATSLVVAHGGSLSGEHGDGQARAEFLEKMFGRELVGAFEEFKSIWDPDWKLNPGKLVRPYRVDENLRFGPHYNPREPETAFSYESDGFSFVHAAERCVGVGKCRKDQAGTMCPSYMATGEEMHSTRGRARLLFEMLQGETIQDGWGNRTVHESLDLCLACKGCKGECPVHVDMATYKAEFLHHYYKRRIRPISAYAFGYIHQWARLASIAPGVANFFAGNRILSKPLRWLTRLAPEREMPRFAKQTFKSWFEKRAADQPVRPPVILWPDTFNNFFHPATARAAVAVLEDAGFRVLVPRQDMCCGRPFYDFGMLRQARKYLEDILRKMAPEIEAGLPFVILEPSCCSVFRDELCNLLPHDQNARRLRKQSFTLAEFLNNQAPNYRAPVWRQAAVLHGHCHQKALMKMDADAALLERMGMEVDLLDAGCCGMAGAFGFEKGEHYRVSIACGERVLLPRVRSAGEEELLILDGFSCREQVAQTTGRKPMHLAEVLEKALSTGERESPRGEVRAAPVAPQGNGHPVARDGSRKWLGVTAAVAAAGAAAWGVSKHRGGKK